MNPSAKYQMGSEKGVWIEFEDLLSGNGIPRAAAQVSSGNVGKSMGSGEPGALTAMTRW